MASATDRKWNPILGVYILGPQFCRMSLTILHEGSSNARAPFLLGLHRVQQLSGASIPRAGGMILGLGLEEGRKKDRRHVVSRGEEERIFNVA